MGEITLDELLKIDFVGGTLVEYKEGSGFDVEFSRAEITSAGIIHDKEWKQDFFSVLTSDKKCVMEINTALFEELCVVRKEGNVYYFMDVYSENHALAPKGVVIPGPSRDN